MSELFGSAEISPAPDSVNKGKSYYLFTKALQDVRYLRHRNTHPVFIYYIRVMALPSMRTAWLDINGFVLQQNIPDMTTNILHPERMKHL